MAKFDRMVSDLSLFLNLEDDRENLVETLTKIESRLNHMIEARNHIHEKDRKEARAGPIFSRKTVEMYEKELQKERMD